MNRSALHSRSLEPVFLDNMRRYKVYRTDHERGDNQRSIQMSHDKNPTCDDLNREHESAHCEKQQDLCECGRSLIPNQDSVHSDFSPECLIEPCEFLGQLIVLTASESCKWTSALLTLC